MGLRKICGSGTWELGDIGGFREEGGFREVGGWREICSSREMAGVECTY